MKVGERNQRATLVDRHGVFQTQAEATLRIVKAGLDADNVANLQAIVTGVRERGAFMDGHAEAVPQAVHVADDVAGLAARRGVPCALEEIQHRFLQFASRLARFVPGVQRHLKGA